MSAHNALSITVLSDNRAAFGLQAEHGLSLWIETDEPQRLERTAEALKEYAIPHVLPCHCTGDAACAYLAERLGSSVQRGYAGMKVSL